MLMKQNGLAAGEADLLGAIQAHLLASNLEKEVSVPPGQAPLLRWAMVRPKWRNPKYRAKA